MADQLTSMMLLADSLNRESLTEKVAHYMNEHPVGLLYFDIQQFGEIEQKYGQMACQQLLEAWKQLIVEAERSGTFGVFAYRMFGDDVLIFVRMEREAGKTVLLRLACEMCMGFQKQLNDSVDLNKPVEFHIGTALLVPSGGRTVENLLYVAIKEAIGEAKSKADSEYRRLQAEFYDILAEPKITAHYQPIVSLSSGTIYGYEALARGPQTSYFATPDRLWEFAEKEHKLYALEKVARQRAIEGFSPDDLNWKLFINLNANVIHDPQFTPGQTLALLEKRGLTPQHVVFEITERQSIDDYASFTKVLDHYRNQGYRIAIDDAGAGYSSLQAIAELRPDYIKIDRSIIHGIDRDNIKAILLETLAIFAQKIGCQLIAEGIETFEELNVVSQLDVPFGQGYLFARPHPNLPPVSKEVIAVMR
ncbi:EAL domain-containing protein (putative c-di-GMP-specific phosphodiesterase class I) [Anoxybacillus tepidamans]|uniref:EAL domain-containing protein (Putative c-di-GMP-specific phosphodiesterase class I) n=1 Tax=Anoxybacteroides tepidamans TaxID=265948 RepID=A0A7W8IP58_9BACL|nr:GGDEF domain-containing phosphodiesterase [Anoxybacillus tepidamans]MBB5324155.1 EAL domain-containing protein (putative c-di-GMP-specific phosphodiesterase class I) [Anoxybacillus tepidamans]